MCTICLQDTALLLSVGSDIFISECFVLEDSGWIMYLIYVHVCVCVCMYVCVLCMCMYTCMYACNSSVHACMHACMYACMYVCTYVFMHFRIYVFNYICILYIRSQTCDAWTALVLQGHTQRLHIKITIKTKEMRIVAQWSHPRFRAGTTKCGGTPKGGAQTFRVSSGPPSPT